MQSQGIYRAAGPQAGRFSTPGRARAEADLRKRWLSNKSFTFHALLAVMQAEDGNAGLPDNGDSRQMLIVIADLAGHFCKEPVTELQRVVPTLNRRPKIPSCSTATPTCRLTATRPRGIRPAYCQFAENPPRSARAGQVMQFENTKWAKLAELDGLRCQLGCSVFASPGPVAAFTRWATPAICSRS